MGLLLILICAGAMLLLMWLRQKHYGIPAGKACVLLVYTIATGIGATKVLYFIEVGGWEGMSFFGAVLFLPILLWPMARLLKLPYGAVTGLLSLPGLLMFSIHKLNCYIQGCCGGIIIGYGADRQPIYLAIQLIESAVTVLIVAALFLAERKGKFRDILYPLSMVVYGVARFALNWFRLDASARILWLPKGNFWALVAIVYGVVWILILHTTKIERALKAAERKELL